MSVENATIRTAGEELVRPYSGLEWLMTALDGTLLSIGGSSYSPGRIVVVPELLPTPDARLEVYFDEAGLREVLGSETLQIPPSEVVLSCRAFGSVVARSQTLGEWTVDVASSPIEIDLAGDPLIFESPNGFDVRVALVLRSELKPQEFRPHRAGTWLSSCRFSIMPATSGSMFAVLPLDEAVRTRLALPKGCTSYVEVGDDLLAADALDEEIVAYVDPGILGLLRENSSGLAVGYLQTELAANVASAILVAVGRRLREGGSFGSADELAESASPAWTFVQRVAEGAGIEARRLLDAAADDPGLLRTCVESFLETQIAAAQLLKGER
jgi:hypothetical protein